MQVQKVSKSVIQTNAMQYKQQLLEIKQQLLQQNNELSKALSSMELPYVRKFNQRILNNITEQIQLCERLRYI